MAPTPSIVAAIAAIHLTEAAARTADEALAEETSLSIAALRAEDDHRRRTRAFGRRWRRAGVLRPSIRVRRRAVGVGDVRIGDVGVGVGRSVQVVERARHERDLGSLGILRWIGPVRR